MPVESGGKTSAQMFKAVVDTQIRVGPLRALRQQPQLQEDKERPEINIRLLPHPGQGVANRKGKHRPVPPPFGQRTHERRSHPEENAQFAEESRGSPLRPRKEHLGVLIIQKRSNPRTASPQCSGRLLKVQREAACFPDGSLLPPESEANLNQNIRTQGYGQETTRSVSAVLP